MIQFVHKYREFFTPPFLTWIGRHFEREMETMVKYIFLKMKRYFFFQKMCKMLQKA